MSAEENKTLARRFFHEFDRRNLAALDSVFAPDYVFHVPGSPGPMNWEAHKQFAGMFYEAFPDLAHTIEDQVADGDRVATRIVFRGTHRGDLMGIPASGKQVAMSGIAIHRVVAGKFAEEWVNFDQLGLLQQIGAIPTPG